MFNPDKDKPKTVEQYIDFISYMLMGDSGWRYEDIESLLKKFADVVREEDREERRLFEQDYDMWDW